MGKKIELHKTKIKGVYVGKINSYNDKRGQFKRLFDFKEIKETLNEPIREINLSQNKFKGTVRGLHYENTETPSFKIIKCIKGQIIDKIVDIRKKSNTFLSHISINLQENDNQLIFIPNKVAHGFQTLTNNTEIIYMHTMGYNQSIEGGLNINDPNLNLDWNSHIAVISDRDKSFPLLNKDFDGI